jgi:hypothetical protein
MFFNIGIILSSQSFVQGYVRVSFIRIRSLQKGPFVNKAHYSYS